MATVTCRSPGGPPRRPAWPNPGSRSTAWSAVPAGTSMSSGSVCGVTPRPSHAAHRAAGCRPLPAAGGAGGGEDHVAAGGAQAPAPAAGDALGPACRGRRRSRRRCRTPHRGSTRWCGGSAATIAASGTVRVTCRSAPRCGRPGALGDVQGAAEEITEGRLALGVDARGEVEAGEAGGARCRRRQLAVVVAAATLGIDQRLVRRQDVAEARRGFTVAGIDVGVIAAGEAPVGAPDVLGAGARVAPRARCRDPWIARVAGSRPNNEYEI